MAQNAVLIVDDDIKIAKLLQTYFEAENFMIYLAHDGYQALNLAREKNPSIIVLDVMLPGLNGWEVCRQVRRNSNIPILMLTAREEEADRLIGLEIGADDYVTKPFSPREVVARVKAILRRTEQGAAKPPELVRAGSIVVDTMRYAVSKAGSPVDVTPTEFKILELLATNPGRVFTRLQIVEQVQGYAFEGYERTIDAHIKNLRRKLEENPKDPRFIQTVYGVGYRFAGDEHA